MEHGHIYPVLNTQQIITDFRYVDDILIMYDQTKQTLIKHSMNSITYDHPENLLIMYDKNKTNTDQTLNEFNNLRSSRKFTIEKESHEEINFLDLTIHHKAEKLEFSIYRKPTQTNIIIPISCCHPYEYKLLGINYLLN
jgi:hypothetical protein